MKKSLFVIICSYSLIMTVVALYPLLRARYDVSVIYRRYWVTDEKTTDSSISYSDVEFDDIELEDVTALTPTVNSSVLPGYFLLDSDEPFTRRCGRCSLVSSAGHLLDSGAGVDIDRADCVLRMNTAPVSGWTEDVGSRTDVRIIGHVNLPRGLVLNNAWRREILSDDRTRTEFIVVPWLYEEDVDLETNKFIKVARNLKRDYPHVKFVFQTREKHNETENRFKLDTGYTRKSLHTWFSTGFVSMLVALDMCEEVDVYGLANGDFCRLHPKSRVPYHYYEPSKRTECEYHHRHEFEGGHKFMTERAIFARWSLIYKINFHYPSWRAAIANVSANIDTPFLRKYSEALQNVKLPKPKSETVVRNGTRFRVVRKRVPKNAPAANLNKAGKETPHKNGMPIKKVYVIHKKKTVVNKIVKRVPKQVPKV